MKLAAAVGVALAALTAVASAQARPTFVPNDPLAAKQWHLVASRAFDAWTELPTLAPVRIAVVDSGVDGKHPELADRIVGSRSFVGGSALVDSQGHGTFVAGLIAATIDDGVGIAGMAPSAQLLIAKVVRADRTIPLDAEAKAIRWAADNGARVINLSLGGVRDPIDPRRDTFSPAEARAIAYAHGKGAVIVAAVGNADQAPETPWRYASYPAALPHVIGVSALARDGSIPSFSNRDPIFNDIAAPGEDLISTLPRALTASRTSCLDQGYSVCGPFDYRRAEGTSFAAPQVAAAAAVLLGYRPGLKPGQVAAILEHSAADANASTGCRRCPLQRDSLSGWGSLDVAAAVGALAGPLPPADAYESNDDAGPAAFTLWGADRRIEATLDFWDDHLDVYAVRLKAGQRLSAVVSGPEGTDTNLVLWRPGTTDVERLTPDLVTKRAAQSARPGSRERLVYTARAGGWYYIEVRLSTEGFGPYSLVLSKR